MSAVDVGMGRWVVATCGTCGTIFLHSLNCFKICFWIKSYYPDALFLDDIFFFSMLLPKCSLALRLHQKWLRDSLLKFWVCIRNLQKVHVKCVPKEYFVWISGIFFFAPKQLYHLIPVFHKLWKCHCICLDVIGKLLVSYLSQVIESHVYLGFQYFEYLWFSWVISFIICYKLTECLLPGKCHTFSKRCGESCDS